jgi:hypothetical protein
MRLYGILLLVTVVVVLYMTRGAHQTQTSDFYTKTEQALQDREHAEATKQRDAERSKRRRLQTTSIRRSRTPSRDRARRAWPVEWRSTRRMTRKFLALRRRAAGASKPQCKRARQRRTMKPR